MEDIRKEVTSLDDSALRQQLLEAQIPIGPIVRSTRPIFEKKLIEFKSKLKGISPSPGEISPSSVPDQMVDKKPIKDAPLESPTMSTPKRTNSDSFYVVCIPLGDCDATKTEFETPSKAESHMFEDQKEALKLLKKNPGARFKVFRSRKDAESFAGLRENLSTPRSTEPESKGKSAATPIPKPAQDSPNQFHSPKSQQYVALRKAIINQDKEKFKELVWSNPRYLISTGDTPTILQEGSRYNAVHICAQKNLPEMCSLVLDTLQKAEFVRLMYPDEPEPTLIQRMNHIADLYINVPDKGNFETPLHFACKFGNAEMVDLLLSYKVCERGCTNRYGQTPDQIICSRSNASKTEKEALKEKIMTILDHPEDEVFIPVFRSEDNTSPPHIGQPWSPASSDSQSGQSFNSLKSPVDVEWCVKAFAGPMSPKEASDLYQKWKGIGSVRSPEDRRIQRSDDEKGLERIGRRLSQSVGVPWKEYWDFLDEFVDLASPEGLQKLEDYLSEKYKESIEMSSVGTVASPALLETSLVERDSVDDVVKDLNIQFNDMDLQETSENSKPPETLSNGRVVMAPSDHSAPNERASIPQGKVNANSHKPDQIADVSEEKVTIVCDKLKGTKNSDNPTLSIDVDDLCHTFSMLRVSGGSSTSESDDSIDKTSGAGDHRRGPRMVSNSETDRKDATEGIGSTASTTERLESLGDAQLTNADNSLPESVFSSPDENLSKLTKKLSLKVGKGKSLYIIGDAPSRRDMDVYHALQRTSLTDKYPLVKKWKKEIESVEDNLRSKWPTPQRSLRRSTSNPNFPSSPMTSQSQIFSFSPQRIGNQTISPVQLYRPLSDPRSTGPSHLSGGVSSPPVARLFAS